MIATQKVKKILSFVQYYIFQHKGRLLLIETKATILNKPSMKKLLMKFSILLAATCTLLMFFGCKKGTQVEEKKGPAIIAYIKGGEALDISKIAAEKVTHIYYAFATIKDNKVSLADEATDTENLKKLNSLKESNPDLKVLVSVACRDWSKTFSQSEAIDTKAFAASVVDIIKKNNLDGIDINWGYPLAKNSKDIVNSTDYSQTYINTINSTKAELTTLGEAGEKGYILSCTVETYPSDALSSFIIKTQEALDYINLITYNYQDEKIAIHQSPLSATDKYDIKKATNLAVNSYITDNGISAQKIVIGIPFSGCVYKVKKNSESGIGDPITERMENRGYTYIKDSLVNKNEYFRYWDNAAQAPYLYNFYKSILISYDDEESIKAKCQYVKENNLAGVMVWEYSDDPKGFLLNTINQSLK